MKSVEIAFCPVKNIVCPPQKTVLRTPMLIIKVTCMVREKYLIEVTHRITIETCFTLFRTFFVRIGSWTKKCNAHKLMKWCLMWTDHAEQNRRVDYSEKNNYFSYFISKNRNYRKKSLIQIPICVILTYLSRVSFASTSSDEYKMSRKF